MNKQFTIPMPLAPGASVRWNEDKTVRYFNPLWESKINDPNNVEFLETIDKSLMTDELHKDPDKVSMFVHSLLITVTE